MNRIAICTAAVLAVSGALMLGQASPGSGLLARAQSGGGGGGGGIGGTGRSAPETQQGKLPLVRTAGTSGGGISGTG